MFIKKKNQINLWDKRMVGLWNIKVYKLSWNSLISIIILIYMKIFTRIFYLRLAVISSLWLLEKISS